MTLPALRNPIDEGVDTPCLYCSASLISQLSLLS